jgi:hypothetical protein
LRHAMVKVAAAPMPVVTSEDETKEPGWKPDKAKEKR